MMKYSTLLLIGSLLSIILPGCKDQSSVEEESITFVGLKYFDEVGNPIGADANDDGDWLIGDTWQSQESDLFESSLAMVNCETSETYYLGHYPNPCGEVVNLYINQPSNSEVDIRIVDKALATLISLDAISTNTLAINTGALGILDTVRVYYKFKQGDCEYRGHGDILIQ